MLELILKLKWIFPSWHASIRAELSRIPIFKTECVDVRKHVVNNTNDDDLDPIEIVKGYITCKVTPEMRIKMINTASFSEAFIDGMEVYRPSNNINQSKHSLIKYFSEIGCVTIFSSQGHPTFMIPDSTTVKNIQENGHRPDNAPIQGYLEESLDGNLFDDGVEATEKQNPNDLIRLAKKVLPPGTLIEKLALSMNHKPFELTLDKADTFCIHKDHMYALSSQGNLYKIHVSSSHASQPSARVTKTATFGTPGYTFRRSIGYGVRLLLLAAYSDARQSNMVMAIDDGMRQVAKIEAASCQPYIRAYVTMFASVHMAMLMHAAYKIKIFGVHGSQLIPLDGKFKAEDIA